MLLSVLGSEVVYVKKTGHIDPAEQVAGKLSDRVEKLYSAGLLTYEEARSELKTVGEKYAAYSGIDLSSGHTS